MLAGGVSLGPENPIIGVTIGLGVRDRHALAAARPAPGCGSDWVPRA